MNIAYTAQLLESSDTYIQRTYQIDDVENIIHRRLSIPPTPIE